MSPNMLQALSTLLACVECRDCAVSLGTALANSTTKPLEW